MDLREALDTIPPPAFPTLGASPSLARRRAEVLCRGKRGKGEEGAAVSKTARCPIGPEK